MIVLGVGFTAIGYFVTLIMVPQVLQIHLLMVILLAIPIVVFFILYQTKVI